MNVHKIVIGLLIYMFWSLLIGYLIASLLAWALIIAALVAGVYAGFKVSRIDGTKNGFIAGLAGGLLLGLLSMFMPTLYGIPLSTMVSELLNPYAMADIPFASVVVLAGIGALFGAVGGFFGAINQMRKIFLFFVLFTLFMFYLALDNVAWYLGTRTVEWSMSHVLTHWVDITVSLAFAFAVVLLAHILKIYQ